nr:iron-containing alcohol dehydrogenase [Clostridiales bacterium]
THAVEAYIGHSNTPHTIDMSEKAVKLIFDNLETAYNDGANIQARENMLKGSFYAGVAFTRAYVGYVHAIAHNLGGLYGVPHGLANAIILPYVLEAYGSSAYKPLAKLADIAGITEGLTTESEKAIKFIETVKQMNKNMDIPDKFDCIKEEDLPLLIKRAIKEGNPLYPVPKIFNYNDFENVIRKMMK